MPKTTATWNGHIVAASDACIKFDNNTYFPPEALNKEFFATSTHTSVCGWKGTATYMDIVVDGKTNANAMWVYSNPKSAASAITGYVAFWKGVEVQGAEFAKAVS
jgi:uncharacterized protein (DUF427 family)